jgi:two-component system response regulator RpaA
MKPAARAGGETTAQRSESAAHRQTARILVVEDDRALARVVADNLRLAGFDVRHAGDGHEATRIASSFHPDLVILDIMLPDTTGFDLCGALRRRGGTAVIILTALGQKTDKLHGLRLGADDYVTKPFDIDELLARVRAVLRRARSTVGLLTLGTTVVDLRRQLAWRGGSPIDLTTRECELLRYLAERRDQVVYRDELLKEVWGYPDTPLTRAVDNSIARLRKKIEPDPHHPQFIRTVFGDGYCLSSGEVGDAVSEEG